MYLLLATWSFLNGNNQFFNFDVDTCDIFYVDMNTYLMNDWKFRRMSEIAFDWLNEGFSQLLKKLAYN
jgi:hypothetical protein